MSASVLALCRVPAEPLVWIWSGEAGEKIENAMYRWRDARLTVRRVRGDKMADESSLFDEFASALQFPEYFGENWPALDDCLTDLAWMPPEAGFVLVITQPLRVLERAADVLPLLVRLLASACAEWASPIALGEWWDRPGVAFHIVLATNRRDEADVCDRWAAAGARISSLPT